MKRIFSKKSGFTLVEIIIAFAIFAIMASMIVQILNLMVRRKTSNQKYEDNLTKQEETLIARGKDYNYDTGKGPDGTVDLKFKDPTGADLTYNLDYQLRNWDPDDSRNGINYLVGNIDYSLANAGEEYIPPEGSDDPDSESDIGGGTVMSRFDTRVTATKGISSIRIDVQRTGTAKYTVTVTVDDSKVVEVLKQHAQVTIFFGKGQYGKDGKNLVKIISVNDGAKDGNTLKQVKKCGDSAVNIHCVTGWDGKGSFGGSPVVFTVELAEDIDVDELGFGDNTADGVTFYPYKYKDTIYENIYGAYPKTGSGDPENPEDPEDPDNGDEGGNGGGNEGGNTGGNESGNTGGNESGSTGGNESGGNENGGNEGGGNEGGGNMGGGDNGGGTTNPEPTPEA